jgi:nucleotidyltransferase/DNA polymerase involved in DNA repair
MIACILIPRFSLRVACPEQFDEPVALAPLPGSRQAIGEVSRAAEAAGLHPGMALGEALARCPSLRLVAADPARAAELWDALLGRIEGIGAAVESARPGEAFFAVEGLRRLHGGEVAGVLAAAREAAGTPVRIAVAPNRFAALLAAGRGSRLPRDLSGSGGEALVPLRALRRFLDPLPVRALRGRLGHGEPEEGELLGALGRLGIGTLGKLAALDTDQIADRFGSLGLEALGLARGEDTPLRPRESRPELVAEIELPDGTAGPQLDRALDLLVDRLLADPGREGRTVLTLRLSARIEGGGSWSVEQGLGRPADSAHSIGALLSPRLGELPGPASALRLRAIALGAPLADQLELGGGGRGRRRERLARAVREVRALAGTEALLKVIDVDPRSRVPERRMLLGPLPER